MRILIITYEFPPLGGGIGTAVYQMVKDLAKRHRVEILTSGFRNLPIKEEKDGLIIHRVPVVQRDNLFTGSVFSILSFLPLGLKLGFSLLRKEKFDLIHSYLGFPVGVIGVILSKYFSIPHVITLIGGEIIDSKQRFRYEGERVSLVIRLIPFKKYIFGGTLLWVLRNSKAIAATSNDTVQGTYEFLKTPFDIKIIPHGINPPNFQIESREKLGFDSENFLIVTICRLVKRKGLHHIIEAVSRLKNKKIKVLFIGDGPEKQRLIQLSNQLGISDQVVFLGYLSEEKKFQYLAISNIFILTSFHEGFGIVYLEGMYCGLPVIASNRGGQTDFITDGVNGFLIPAGDVEKLTQKIKELIENKELREKMGEANRKKVQDFTVYRESQEYEKIYENIVR